MSKLDLSYLDNIKDGIIKGLDERNLMGDLDYTATCVEMLKSLEQTKSIAINNYRTLQTIEQLEPIDNDNVTDNNIQPLYSCPVSNRNGRIYNVETTKEAILEFTNTFPNYTYIDDETNVSRPILGKCGLTAYSNRNGMDDNALIVHKLVKYIMDNVKKCSDMIIQSALGFMGSDAPWCMRIKRIGSRCYYTMISTDWQFFKTNDETMTYEICWDEKADMKSTDFFEYSACAYADDVGDCDISELDFELTVYLTEYYAHNLDKHLNNEFNCSVYIIYATLDKKSGFYHNDNLIIGNYEHPTDNKEEK